ncbi:MAG: leucine-rich repeat protein [Muribaculaceae bacterium]|nr:leucine-rich repeat protein [Muribaculaceae bacterium]
MKRNFLMMLFGIGLSLVATAANQDLPGYGTVNLEIYYLDASAQGISDKEPMEYAYCVYYSEELSIAAIMRVWEAGNVVLPDHVTINGKSYPVVGLWCSKLFVNGGSTVQQLTLPDGLKFIGNSGECINAPNLKSITIPGTVTYVTPNVFRACTTLKQVTLADGDQPIEFEVDRWYDRPFDWSPVEDIYLGRDYKCNTMLFNSSDNGPEKRVTISPKMTQMNDQLFYYDKRVVQLTLMEGVTNVGNQAFMYCTGLKQLKVPNSMRVIGSQAFENTSIEQLNLGHGVQFIMERAFNGTNITSLTLPASLDSLYSNSFRYSRQITDIVIEDSPRVLKMLGREDYGNGSFFHLDNPYTVYQGRNIESTDPPFYSTKLKSIVMGDRVTQIAAKYLQGCSQLQSVLLSKNLTAIPDRAFFQCAAKEIVVPDKVITIGQEAFRESPIERVTLGKSTAQIGWRAFWNDGALTEVTSLNTVPPVCDSETFSNSTFSNATLYVPRTAINSYKDADVWKNFFNVSKVVIRGDMNGDDKLDVEDVNAAINIVLKVKTAADYEGSADMDGNGKTSTATTAPSAT